MKSRMTFFLLILSLVVIIGDRSLGTVSQTTDAKRIRFRVATIEEKAGERNIISETIIEGPPGTDFNINLHDERFKMNARFLTDLVDRDSLKVRATLDTRRLYGRSERDLPLYEEDAQKQTLQLGFDEAIVLLPFGRNGGDVLKIEITPERSDTSVRKPSGELRPLSIDILKPSPGGAINARATKQPHNFEVEAALLENGREVARGTGDFLLEESGEIVLRAIEQASAEVVNNPLAIKFTVDSFLRRRPFDQIAINFDAHRITSSGRDALAMNWAGIADMGADLKYDLTRQYSTLSDKRYELRFNIKLAKGESVD